MSKGSDLLTRLAGIASMIASAAFFADIATVDKFVVPGLLFGASGLWMLVRRGERRPTQGELETQQRLAALSQGLAATQQEMASMQDQLSRLSEERDFLRQLSTPPRAPAIPEPHRPAGVPASPVAAEQPAGHPHQSDSAPPA